MIVISRFTELGNERLNKSIRGTGNVKDATKIGQLGCPVNSH